MSTLINIEFTIGHKDTICRPARVSDPYITGVRAARNGTEYIHLLYYQRARAQLLESLLRTAR